ncbi:hypothetical protein [Anaerotalea alkaliphila]|uniref:Uncharacterized protein n=1 Tax=Anaerotalea alkaliphila TaxID=2662126 RepID=A0A7X5HTL9_9FIRM|nr:hypothetical protein [Anaerotalea alkaliphila]NDL66433.1 hypothetical protein [Anaerotalea alkaliphila]
MHSSFVGCNSGYFSKMCELMDSEGVLDSALQLEQFTKHYAEEKGIAEMGPNRFKELILDTKDGKKLRFDIAICKDEKEMEVYCYLMRKL